MCGYPNICVILQDHILEIEKHDLRMGGVSIISGTLFRVRREPFPTSQIMLIIIISNLFLNYNQTMLCCQSSYFNFFNLPPLTLLLTLES